jgi:predicted phosphodiesterase
MNGFKSAVLTASAILCAIVFSLGVAGIVFDDRARVAAGEMEASEWINNDRSLEKVAAMPAPENGFKFAVFGDVQIGTARLPQLMEELIAREPVDFIIQTGDIVVDPDAGHYRLLLSALARSGLSRPMFVVPGNHDVSEDDDKLFRRYFGSRQSWFERGGALFILLDNSLAPFTDEQGAWLEKILSERGAGVDHVLFFMHGQPIYWEGDGRGPVAHLFTRFNEILEKHEIDYVFAGNWHGYHKEERDGTIFVVNGRGGSGSKLVPCFYTIVQVDERGVSDKLFELPPRVDVLARSLVVDWLVAHTGEPIAGSRPLAFAILFLAGAGCVCFAIAARKARSRNAKGAG